MNNGNAPPERRARLLLLITELQMGGAARVVRELADALSARFQVTEAVFNASEGVDFAGPRPVSLDVAGGGGLFAKLLNLFRRVRRVRQIKAELGIDVSISHLEGAHWVDVLSRQGEKTVLCVHGSILHNGDIRGLSGWVRRRVMLPLIYPRADRVVTVSRDIAPELVAMGVPAKKITTINNFFDVAAIEQQSREPLGAAESALFGEVPVLLTAGRLADQKNQAPLVDIMAELVGRRPARLLILGDGPLRKALLEKAAACGLRSWNVWSGEPLTADRDLYFLGVRENPFAWMRRADLFLLPSAWEGFPLALCEAMICGVPVVSSDCMTGPREILAPESAAPVRPIARAEMTPRGVLMPIPRDGPSGAGSRGEWVGTLNDLLGKPALLETLSGLARRRMDDFSRDRISAQWIALVEGLAATDR